MFGTRPLGLVALLVFACAALAPRSAVAQAGTGQVTGIVIDKNTQKPLELVNVVIRGQGQITGKDGRFSVPGVPPGTYDVNFQLMGYQTEVIAGIAVRPNETTSMGSIGLKTSVVMRMEAIDIREEADKLRKDSSQQVRTISKEQQKIRAINTTDEALATQAGVVQLGGALFIRGGRSTEVKTVVDGMPISDAFAGSGGSGTMAVSLTSQAELNLLTGGFDAEYGNAQSGVVEIKTREGGPQYSGQLKFLTDDFGAPDKTYFNYDNVAFGFGGPVPFTGDRFRFYASGEGVFQDTYLKTREVRPARKLFFNSTELASLRDRQENAVRGQAKLTWRLNDSKKISAEYLFSRSDNDWYHHSFSRVGYWSQLEEEWWFDRLDTTYTYYNGPEHLSARESKGDQYKLVYTHPLTEDSWFKVRGALFRNRYDESVGGKAPGEYVPFSGNDNERDPENLFYTVVGDYPVWEERQSKQYTFRADYQNRVGAIDNTGGNHELKTGVTLNYYDFERDERLFPDEDTPEGNFPNQFQENAFGGVVYMQDRLRYKKSMVLNAGLRFDFFDPGESAIRKSNQRVLTLEKPTSGTSFLERWKAQVSPRVGMSYPISDRDVLHFHYGRFFQLPDLELLYDHSNNVFAPNRTVGNAFLEPETTISYQFGVRRQLTDEVFLDATVFFKDIFGLIGTKELEAENETEQADFQSISYFNRDYGSARGLELSLEKRFSGYWQGGLTYTLQRATGSSSDVNQGATVATEGLDREPIKEVPLNWDRTHVFNAFLYLSDPGIWGVNLDFSVASGAPTTPFRLGQRTVSAEDINTIRLPKEMTLNLRANKQYALYGQEFRLFLEGRNILDRKNVRGVRPDIWPLPTNDYYRQYFTEFGELGGAYNLADTIGTPDDILVPLNDPRVYSESRVFRVGVQFEF